MNLRTPLTPLFALAVFLVGMGSPGFASHAKPPHGFWTGKVVRVTESTVTLAEIEGWEYGSVGRSRSGKAETFKPGGAGFTIDEQPVAKQNLALHFKVGEIVTLRWTEEMNGKNRVFFDISKGR